MITKKLIKAILFQPFWRLLAIYRLVELLKRKSVHIILNGENYVFLTKKAFHIRSWI